MKKTDSMKEMILIRKLKSEDPVELPMEEIFFDNLHDKIMLSVEKTEVKKLSKLAKTWVFLERKTHGQRGKLKKAAKVGVSMMMIAMAVGLVKVSLERWSGLQAVAADFNKASILTEAEKNPMEWSELALSYQNENDFYSEVLSQRDASTMVEINQALTLPL